MVLFFPATWLAKIKPLLSCAVHITMKTGSKMRKNAHLLIACWQAWTMLSQVEQASLNMIGLASLNMVVDRLVHACWNRLFTTWWTNRLERCWNNHDWENFISNSSNNVNKLFSSFYNGLNKLTNKHAPLKNISKRKAKQLNKPWITKGLKKFIKIKNHLFYLGDFDKYKLYRNKILTLTRISKKNYYHTYFNNNLKNMKRIWVGINSLINREQKVLKPISALKCPNNNEITRNPSKITNILNDHFSTIGQKLASNISNSKKHFSDYLAPDGYAHSFFFNPVLFIEIESEIISFPCIRLMVCTLVQLEYWSVLSTLYLDP